MADQQKIQGVALDVFLEYQEGNHFVTDYHAIVDKLSLAGLDSDYVDAVYYELRSVFGLSV